MTQVDGVVPSSHTGRHAHTAAALCHEAFRYQEKARPAARQQPKGCAHGIFRAPPRSATKRPRFISPAASHPPEMPKPGGELEAQACSSGEGAVFHLNFEIIFKHISKSVYRQLVSVRRRWGHVFEPQLDTDGDMDQKVTARKRVDEGVNPHVPKVQTVDVTESHPDQPRSQHYQSGSVYMRRRVQGGTLPVGRSSPLAGNHCWFVQTSG